MRHQGQYVDLGSNTYGGNAQMQHMPGQRMDRKSSNFHGRSEANEGQWRWDRDGPNLNASDQIPSAQMFNDGQVGEASRSLYQSPRTSQKITLDKQGSNDPRSWSHEGDMETGYENIHFSQTFEMIQQRFLDDVLKLAKEQNDAEDAENSRHSEKLKLINDQYQEQLVALRARNASSRNEVLQMESQARKNEYQHAMMTDNYQSSGGMGPNEAHRAYNSDGFDPQRDHARFLGGARDHGFEPRGPYPGGRVYHTGSRY